MIRRKGSRFCVYSHRTGRKFGCYGSRKKARRRLAQMKRFGKR